MKLIAYRLANSDRSDRLRFLREDGSACEIDMPRQGILPHDLLHYVVEQGLHLKGGFLSLVAQGAEARFAMEITHSPERKASEESAVQAEALVEALQTQLWSGAFDPEAFNYGVETASQVRGIGALRLSAAEGQRLFDSARTLHQQWAATKPQSNLELVFAP